MNKYEKYIYNELLSGSPICTDSRKILKTSVFFAIKGENFDGNDFAYDALNNGCKLAVVDKPKIKTDERFILVPDVVDTLQNIAKHHRNKFNIPFIGITGTNGKTTTKEILFSVLSKKNKTFATKGNLNNHIGVPITLLSIKDDTEIAVIEMGANNLGEIYHLCILAKPTHGIITNIGKAHLEGFRTTENIKKAKSELYNYIKENKGKLFVNFDNKELMQLSENLPRITYGKSQNADHIGKIEENSKFLKVAFSEKNYIHKKYTVNTNLIGSYNFENVMAAVCIGSFFGVQKEDIRKAIEEYFPKNNRSQYVKTKRNTVLMDAYNANPTSMKLAVENFTSMKLDNKVAILGDMLELGKNSKKEHSEIFNLVIKQGYDKIILVGEEFCSAANKHENIIYFKKTEDLIFWLKEKPVSNRSILIKASRGIELEKILDYL